MPVVREGSYVSYKSLKNRKVLLWLILGLGLIVLRILDDIYVVLHLVLLTHQLEGPLEALVYVWLLTITTTRQTHRSLVFDSVLDIDAKLLDLVGQGQGFPGSLGPIKLG